MRLARLARDSFAHRHAYDGRHRRARLRNFLRRRQSAFDGGKNARWKTETRTTCLARLGGTPRTSRSRMPFVRGIAKICGGGMKPAIEWLEAIGESTMADILLGGDPGCRTERVIAAIQADALREAAARFDADCCEGFSW